jgi:Bacterial SH3 domain
MPLIRRSAGGDVPSKIRPDDWDRLFAPNAPRRGGPLRALVNVLIVIVFIAILSGSIIYVLRLRDQRTASFYATSTAVAPTVAAQRTSTAVAQTQATATVVARRTATAVARTPTAVPALGIGTVANGGNLREQPGVAGKAIGLIWPGDQITFLEQGTAGGQIWFRVRVTKVADNRGGDGVNAGTVGWAAASLLSQPTPAPPTP